MSNLLAVKCPDCKLILMVDPKTGEVIEVQRKIIDDTTGDRFEDARQKVKSAHERAEQKFADAKKKESERFAKLDALFNEKKEELKDQPLERPDRPFDRD